MSNAARFTVDTHLFRELGELLVGRDSTALIELIKNSYDADATAVSVLGRGLDDVEHGEIVVVDNGNGMTRDEFEKGFLRIASRSKEGGDRRSKRFQRRFTGQKGVGRLAAHKLASTLDVISVPYTDGRSAPRIVKAHLDWKAIEAFDSLDEVDESALSVESLSGSRSRSHGTEIRLSGLRRAWTNRQRGLFLREMSGFAPPTLLTSPSSRTLPFPLFPGGISPRDVGTKPGREFVVRLEGEFNAGDDYHTLAENSASWILEIDARGEVARVAVTPTPVELAVTPKAEAREFSLPRSTLGLSTEFVARVLVHEGSRDGIGELGPHWPAHLTGIRVYMEGFRVLPYGEPSDDWLALDAMYKRRTATLNRLRSGIFGAGLDREAQSTLGNASYVGAVFLTEAGSPGLEMLVNREGFVPSESFESLAEAIGTAVDLTTRTRAAASQYRREIRRTQRRVNAQSRSDISSPEELAQRIDEMSELVAVARVHASKGNIEEALAEVSRAADMVAEISVVTLDLASEQSMLRVLASLGTQMSAFIHEVNGLLALAQQIEPLVASQLKGQPGVRQILNSMTELRRGLERQASYLLDVVTPDARRRRSAQSVRDRFDAACSLVALSAARRDVEIVNDIAGDLRTPPMFRAELTAVLANLVTNAVKNAGQPGLVRAGGELDDDRRLHVVIENTGIPVDPADGEKWFQPFESTTVEIDTSLGQGMGLGLPITRAMLADYGGLVTFTKPSPGFATAVEIVLPKGRFG